MLLPHIHPRSSRRWVLMVILCVLASLLVSGIASASTAASAETRVGAFDLQNQIRIEGAAALTLNLHLGCAPTYDQLASDSLLAAKGGGRTVIGRTKDLMDLPAGERSLLDRLPDQGSPKANWKQNSGVLREEMRRGQPIRDASPGDTGGQFLNAERALLRNRGWTFDSTTNLWTPPGS